MTPEKRHLSAKDKTRQRLGPARSGGIEPAGARPRWSWRRKLGFGAFVALVMLFGAFSSSFEPYGVFAAEKRHTEEELKATYLIRFGSFVEWPLNKSPVANSPFIIGIVGNTGVAAELEKYAQNKTNVIAGRRAVIRRLEPRADFSECHILFVGRDADFATILAAVKPTGILTVGEHEKFIQRGGMINFVLDQNTVKFQVNPKAAMRAGLEISSKLLEVVSGWKMLVNIDPPRGDH